MRFDNFVLKPLNTGGLTAVSGALITVCTSAGTGTPCTPKVANIYSDEALTTPIVGTGGAGTTNSDSGGNFGFYAAPGSYVVTVTGSGITSYTIKVVLPLGALTNNAVGKWNSIITVDGTQFTTCDAAVTAAVTQAGSGTALVIVPSTYAGADCTTIPTNVKVQVWYFNGTEQPAIQSGVYWNNTSSTPIHSWLRLQDNDASPAGNSLSLYAVHRITGAIPASSAMDAISPEVQTYGTISSWGANSALQANENVVTIASTGGTISDVRTIVGNVQSTAGSSSNITNVSGLYFPTFVKSGTGTWGVVTGALFNKQTAGSTSNWAAQFFGTTLFSFSAAGEQLQITGNATANSNGLSIANTAASGHTWVLGETFGVGHFSFRDTTQGGTPWWSLAVTGASGVEGVLSHAITANRTWTFPDATGTVPLLSLAQTWTAAQTHTGAAIIPDQTSGITGTTTNNNANAGAIGEYVQSVLATGSSVTLATGVTSNVTSISLTAGDWDVTGAVDFTFGATTSYTNLIGSVSSTSATIGGQDSKFDFETPAAVPTAGADATFPVPVVRFSLSGTTTVFLVAQGTFTVSTLKAYGTIRARRIR